MRVLTSVAVATALLAGGAAFAPGAIAQRSTAMQNRGNCAHVHPVPCYLSDGTPIDHGAQTPDANKAYEGGGVVLQGAPGAPAPNPSSPTNLPPSR